MRIIEFIQQRVKQHNQPQNALLVLHPYYHNEAWVFDDEEKGLVKEPFVAGADDFIEHVLSKTGNLAIGKKGFTLLFSQKPFMGQQHVLAYQSKAYGGSLYTAVSEPDFRNQGNLNQLWLCPALFKYFRKAPKKLYVQLKVKLAGDE